MHIRQLLSLQRVVPTVASPSKKALLEVLSELLTRDNPGIDAATALRSLIDREQLGSTGIGEGVALPHGRVAGLRQAVGAFVTLQHEMDYDALDRKPVRMAFALLVPEGANDEHLKLLRELAIVFGNKLVRQRLLQLRSADELLHALGEAAPNS